MNIRGILGRRPRRAAAGAGLALVLVPALLFGARSARDGAPGAAEGPAPEAAQGGEAETLLGAVRGLHPVACALVLQSAGNGWWGAGESEDAPALARRGEETARVLRWMDGRETAHTAADVATLDRALGDADACVRQVAARMLARDRMPGGVDALLAAVRGSDAARREAAIVGLGHAGDARAVGPLRGLLDDADPEVRGGAAWALGHTDSREAAEAVRPVAGDREPRVRRAAARALGRLEDEASIPTLARLLASDPDAGVRRAAAWSLGKIE